MCGPAIAGWTGRPWSCGLSGCCPSWQLHHTVRTRHPASEALRKAACSLVKGAWLFLAAMHMGDGSGAPKHRAWARSVLSGLLRLLLRLAPQLSGYGDFAGPFWEALTWVLKADTAPSNAGSRAAGELPARGGLLGPLVEVAWFPCPQMLSLPALVTAQ